VSRKNRGGVHPLSVWRCLAMIACAGMFAFWLVGARALHEAHPATNGWVKAVAHRTTSDWPAPEWHLDFPQWGVRGNAEVAMKSSLPVQVTLAAWGGAVDCTLHTPPRHCSWQVYEDLRALSPGQTFSVWADPALRGEVVPYRSWLSTMRGALIGLALFPALLIVLCWPWLAPLLGVTRVHAFPRLKVARVVGATLLVCPVLVFTWAHRFAWESCLTAGWLWRERPIRMLENRADTHGGRKGAFHVLRLRYEYDWDGTTYLSNLGAALHPSRLVPLTAMAQSLTASRAATCRVNPRRPWQAQIKAWSWGSLFYLVIVPVIWVFTLRVFHHQLVLGPRTTRIALARRRKQRLPGVPALLRAWMRFVWWLDPFWEFGQKSPATPEKDGAARWTQPGS
jgi:hypothetical protein